MMCGALWTLIFQETCHGERDETVSNVSLECSVARNCPAWLKGSRNQAVDRGRRSTGLTVLAAPRVQFGAPDDRYSGLLPISGAGLARQAGRRCTPARTPRTLRSRRRACAVDRV